MPLVLCQVSVNGPQGKMRQMTKTQSTLTMLPFFPSKMQLYLNSCKLKLRNENVSNQGEVFKYIVVSIL